MKLYAIEHSLGVSVIEASSQTEAIKKARAQFGSYGAPYSLPKDQETELAWAQAMGAKRL